jgi:hypothetical protein
MSLQPPVGWERPTLRHHYELTDRARLIGQPVRCVCGRKELPEDMVDVRGIDGDLRLSRVKQKPAPAVPDFLCAPCVEVLHMKDQIDRVAIAEAMGAPVEWCGWYAAKIARRPKPHGMPKELSPQVAAYAEVAAGNFELADALMVALGQIPSMPDGPGLAPAQVEDVL